MKSYLKKKYYEDIPLRNKQTINFAVQSLTTIHYFANRILATIASETHTLSFSWPHLIKLVKIEVFS